MYSVVHAVICIINMLRNPRQNMLPFVLACISNVRVQVARDLMEDGRCGRSQEIAKSFNVKISDTDPFWKDRAFLELNYAVGYSFPTEV